MTDRSDERFKKRYFQVSQGWNGLTAVGLALFAACTAAAFASPAAGDEFAFVLTTDYYSAAYYSTIEVQPPRTVDNDIASVNTDAVARYDETDNMVFVVNRFLADNIQIVNPDSGFATTGQYSVGNGSNPHDIVLANSGKAYVSRFEWKTLLICDPYSGDSLGVIDLSPFSDGDGIPEMDRMAIADGKLFVTLNIIDHVTWQPAGLGKIAVIDVAADTLIDVDPLTPGVQSIELAYANPYTELRYDRCRGELVIGCLGAWSGMDGGVEVIDPVTLESKGIVATESGLGGDVSDVILSPGTKGYAVIMDAAPWPDNHARLISFDRETGEVLDTLHIQESGMGASLAGIELSRQGELYLCDRDATRPYVRIFDTSADTLLATIDVGVPPYDIVVVQEPYAAVPGPPDVQEALSSALLTAYPNPAGARTTIGVKLSRAEDQFPTGLLIHDVRGRLVRALAYPFRDAGTYEVAWDGKDEDGNPVASGVYYCRLAGDETAAAARIVLIR